MSDTSPSMPTDPSDSNNSPWARRAVYVMLYLALVAAVTWGMSRGRRWALNAYQGDSAQEDWQEWRDEAQKQAEGEGPVSRKVPKSAEPPALVLMRDFYWQCLGGALLVTSALAFSMIFLFGGMLRQSAWQPIEDAPGKPGRR